MKKATQKTQPATLGTKRTCPNCGTKFYDFGKDSLHCPKCQSQFDAEQLSQVPRIPAAEVKKPSKPEKSDDTLMQADELATDDSDAFESVEDLADEDEDLVEDLDTENEEQEF